ncbi:recombinase family protein [Roseomonas oryzicola]|uniref:Recombinase family protein n=1 Tax=Neoroseomonas oryzicola TaxID=535904 RepID=A0A9X9WMW3_9PROT|nr:recombinase family protein [Neoroseomonas oryzicola]NKE20160.1 recombinase family protein [Neoroseomonas oryzicola]
MIQRCAIYARYSSENQRVASIEDQVRVCRARAEREGWQVVGAFTDHAVSGATALRPGYQALLRALRAGEVDVVLTESLDRLSRDQEHIAGFFKQARFAGARIVTLAEGEISELHVGLKGTMGALYLKDLADKTRRGLEGRVREGRSGGGVCYGYRVVRGPIGRDGEPERGLREIDAPQAAVVQRVFREFAAGQSPIAIAKRLNAEGIPGPRGGLWSDGALRGHARVGTGLLRNEIYVGRLVWNRRRWIKDPTTGRRLARQNAAEAVVAEDVPDLRIIDQELWDRVQVRLAEAARPQCSPAGQRSGDDQLWQYRRPRHLLSGKVVCGACGGGFVASARDYLACKAAFRQGACDNAVRLRRPHLEAQVLAALGSELMQPDLVAEFVAEFTRELNRLVAEMTAGTDGKRRELESVRRKLAGLVDAIADGLRAPGLQGRLDELEARKATLEAEIAAAGQGSALPRLHPNIAGLYRERVARLREALEADEGGDLLEEARALIDRVEVHPPAEPGGPPRLELIGELTAMLRAAGVGGERGPRTAKSPLAAANGLDVFLGTRSVDAGTGFEPVTFRL